jgi:hypothetical protein
MDAIQRLDGLSAADLFQLRTNTKRLHTNAVTRINNLISRRASRVDCQREGTLLVDILRRLQQINEQYIATAQLDPQERQAAEVYFQQISQLNERTREAVTNYVGPAPIVRGNWNITDSVINQPLRRGSWNVTQANRQQNSTHQNILPVINPAIQPAPSEIEINNDNTQQPEDDSDATQAKRRKILLEMELEQNKIVQQRELDDLLRNQQRNEEDLVNRIRQEERLISLNNADVPLSPPHHSTPIIRSNIQLPISRLPRIAPDAPFLSASFPLSSRWPKIIVGLQPFNGDPRTWKKFVYSVRATIKDTNMPDSLKLLSLQDALVDEIRKRMAHIFNNGYNFDQAYNELTEKTGSPGLVMHASPQFSSVPNATCKGTRFQHPFPSGSRRTRGRFECLRRTHVGIHLLHSNLLASVQAPSTTSN